MRAEQTALQITASRPGLVQRLARRAGEMWRLWRNRRAMRRLDELSDWELVDTGVSRRDIRLAYEGPILNDPTQRLEEIRRSRILAELSMRRRD